MKQLIINARGDTKEIAVQHIPWGERRSGTSSTLGDRRWLAGYFGQSFDGNRDYYNVLGYKLAPLAGDYLSLYYRGDIAKRIVDLPPQDTWKQDFVLIDGDARSDDENPNSDFIRAWQFMHDGTNEDALHPIRYFEKLDRACGIGQYAIMVIGVLDGLPLSEPVDYSRITGPESILYLAPKLQDDVILSQSDFDTNPQSRRFGKPLRYQVRLGETMGLGSHVIHWSRVIHVAEDTLTDDIYGIPRLESILNRLDDLMKVVGGSSEATWKLIRKGLAIIAKDGYQLPQDETSKENFNSQIDEYDNGLRRILRLGGVEVQDLGSDVVDPSGLFGIIISLIAAAQGIPQRILIGSERGELASSQDMRTWNNVIMARRTKLAEPFFVRPFINRLIKWGALPCPKTNKYNIEWAHLFTPTELEEAQASSLKINAITQFITATGAVDIITAKEVRKILGLPVEAQEVGSIEEGEESPEEMAAFEQLRQALKPTVKPTQLPIATPGQVPLNGSQPAQVVGQADKEFKDKYKVPEAARNNAKKVLRWREKYRDDVKGMTEVGWRRARQLADNEYVGIETVKKMAQFNRHRKNATVAPEYKNEPWRDAGYVAWEGWGGDVGISWAMSITGASED
jgi:hypothetical protein